jgi:putative ABC transport system permease protein
MDWHAWLRGELPAITGDRQQDDDIREELAQHCADRYADLRQRGLTDEAALRQVRDEVRATARRSGRLRAAADPLAGAGVAARVRRALSHIRQDAGFARRRLGRSPGFTLAAVSTLALAIGAVTAIFTVVNGVLLQPLPYPDPDSLVLVWEISPRGNDHNVVSTGNYLDWRDRASSFNALGAFGGEFNAALTGSGEPRRVRAVSFAPEVFDVLRATPARGRLFTAADGEPNGPLVAVIGDRLWRTELGADPAVLDRSITVDGQRYRVVGVLPSVTALPGPNVDVVLPSRFQASDRDERRSHNLFVAGRLKPGVTLDAANGELRAIAAALTAEHPTDLTNWSVNVVSAHADVVRSVRPLLSVLMGVVVVVLLIACANLANLQLARSSSRRAEMAVRAAIGAGRRRLFAQLLTESVVLSLIGGTLGVALVVGLLRTIVAAAPPDIPLLEMVAINWQVLGVAAASTMGSAVLVGVLPAMQASRTDFGAMLHGARVRTDIRQGRLRLMLVTVQVALALVLLVGAALLVRSFWRLQRVDYGFDPTRLLAVQLDLPRARYMDGPAQAGFYAGLLDRLRGVPGVIASAGTSGVPGDRNATTFSFAIEGRPSANPTGREDPVPLQAVTPGYFETMRIPILQGRGVTDEDRASGRPVVVINQTLATRLWPGASPIGQRISFRPGQMPWLEIVGVVGDTHDQGLDRSSPPTLYVPFAQKAPTWGWMSWQTVVVRTDGPPAAVVPAIRAAVWALDPNLPLLNVSTVEAAYAENDARRRFAMQMLGGFASLALLLGAVGVFGVLSCGVSERRQEIGIRMALGAGPGQVASAVVRSVLVFGAAGVAIGVIVAMILSRFLGTLLFQIEPTDPLTFVGTAVLLLIVAALAGWVPVRRALRLDPVEVLRQS